MSALTNGVLAETASEPHRPAVITTRPPSRPRTPRTPRRVRSFTAEDRYALAGSLVSSFALVTVVYEHLVDGSGILGYLLSWFAAFLLTYAGVVGLSNPWPIVVERLVTAALWVAAGVVMLALGSTVVYTFAQGWHAFVHLNFFTKDMSGVSPLDPLNRGGVLESMVGTVVEITIAVAVSLPLGLGTAIYMSEVGGRWSRLVRTVVEAMTALPEILAGLFVYVMLVVGLGVPKSGLAVSVAMAVTMVPIIARAGEVALRIVPNGLREASHALGATHWRTVQRVVLPSARAGLATALILAVARGIGETAIPLLVSGASSFTTLNPLGNPMNSLPLFTFTAYTTHEPTAIARAFGSASVLLVMVLGLFVIARFVSREKAVQR
jgi:phosphate transport system permease protein